VLILYVVRREGNTIDLGHPTGSLRAEELAFERELLWFIKRLMMGR